MDKKERILKFAQEKRQFTTSDVLRGLDLHVSRQTVSGLIKKIVQEGALLKGGSTRGAFYFLPVFESYTPRDIKKRLRNKGLEEHEVFDDVKKQSDFVGSLEDNVFSIFQYAFDEMLNNAIEHSGSEHIEIDVKKSDKNGIFVIKDFGIGVFRSVMKKYGLQSEFEAIQDLLKGKTTTAPKAHSGEGIFFTSKSVDIFILESFGLRLRIDNIIKDVFVEELKQNKKGTVVTCILGIHSDRHLNTVFEKYASEKNDFAFDKTEIRVKLFTMGTVYVSRSQARRILVGLEKFKTVILDFDKVPTVGQAFVDEIFRVFKIKYPNIKIIPVNMNKAVEFMVKRVGA